MATNDAGTIAGGGNKKLPPPGTALNFSSSPHSQPASAIDPRPYRPPTRGNIDPTVPPNADTASPPKEAMRGAGEGGQEHQRTEGVGGSIPRGAAPHRSPADPRREHTAPPSPPGPAGSQAGPRQAEKGEKGEPPPQKSAGGGGGDPLPAPPQRGFCPPRPPGPAHRALPSPPPPPPPPSAHTKSRRGRLSPGVCAPRCGRAPPIPTLTGRGPCGDAAPPAVRGPGGRGGEDDGGLGRAGGGRARRVPPSLGSARRGAACRLPPARRPLQPACARHSPALTQFPLSPGAKPTDVTQRSPGPPPPPPPPPPAVKGATAAAPDAFPAAVPQLRQAGQVHTGSVLGAATPLKVSPQNEHSPPMAAPRSRVAPHGDDQTRVLGPMALAADAKRGSIGKAPHCSGLLSPRPSGGGMPLG
ncbi:basic proline-rich protein-like [Molothrus ater]|uniref:basic proline-rich protein-like n=1 Tax=Molothrus ater TaxID=84834 RepID=UPI00174A3A0D|nr:basic proline-rich protein-like [Molothrus ater]